MIKWLKSLFGIGNVVPHDTMTVEEYKDHADKLKNTGCIPEVKVENADKLQAGNVVMDHTIVDEAPKKKTTTKKKTATKKKATVDLDSMKKNELLAHAKANGIKANASMNKAAILEAIKNG